MLPQPVVTFSKSPATMLADHFVKPGNHGRVPLRAVNRLAIPSRTTYSHDPAGPAHCHTFFLDQPVNRLLALDWLQSFFSSNDLIASFSIARSAYMRLNYEMLKSPYLLFQL